MGAEPVRILSPLRLSEDVSLDLHSRTIRSGDRVLRLERIPFEILLFLIERRGQIVCREEIVSRIWGPNVFVDTDNSIRGAIRKIRQVLEDDADHPRFIETVTGQGYRFIASVADTAPQTNVSTPQLTTLSEVPVSTARPAMSAHRIAVAVIALALIALVATFLWLHFRRGAQRQTGRIMVAVLPFVNLTGDPAQDYFSDGFTEEMITQLGRLNPDHLGVIARTSVLRYKDSRSPLPQIGADLGVQYVLEGSVRRNVDTVRITAKLVQVGDQSDVWSRDYDRKLSDILDVQSEIAQEIGDEVQVTLHSSTAPAGDDKRSLSPRELKGYDLYLRGQSLLSRRTAPDLLSAINLFHQAITEDPNNARSYAALADAYALLGGYSGLPQHDFLAQARAAALHALQLDEALPDAHTALALIVQNYDWDWETADKEFRRAIELDPNYATAHHWYAEHLMWRGQFDEALQESEKARRLDPLSLIIAADNGAILYYSRQYDSAIRQFRSVLDTDPEFPRAKMIVHAYLASGLYSQAIANIPAKNSADNNGWTAATVAFVEGRAGHKPEARQALKTLKRLAERQPVDPATLVWAYLGVGDNQEALDWLQKSYELHSNIMTSLKIDPGFDPLRPDQRFQDLLHRVHLAQ
jgi:TolB-like protein/DNA-binding winged helix-turn-helix (wHTH) protein/Tfp pilus assembly protein PilF